MKLAHLPDVALDALKAKTINLTVAQKLTTADDEKLILEVLQLIAEGRITHTNQIDGVLHPKAVKFTDRRAVFVGAEAYEAAGGKIVRDLFSDDVFFEDRDVLDEVFAEHLTSVGEAIAQEEGWAWVMTHEDAYLSWNFMDEHKFERVYPVEGILSDDLAERYDELAELAEGDVLNEAGESELDKLQAILDGDFTEDQKALAGCVVHVGQDGQLQVAGGLIRSEDKKAAIEAGILANSHHGSSEKTAKNPYSQKLRDDLDAIKLAALQNAMLDQPDLLLDLLAFQLSGMTGLRDVLGLATGQPSNAPSCADGFSVDKRLSKPDATPADRWDVDLKKAFATFKKKGKKHRDAELKRHVGSTEAWCITRPGSVKSMRPRKRAPAARARRRGAAGGGHDRTGPAIRSLRLPADRGSAAGGWLAGQRWPCRAAVATGGAEGAIEATEEEPALAERRVLCSPQARVPQSCLEL